MPATNDKKKTSGVRTQTRAKMDERRNRGRAKPVSPKPAKKKKSALGSMPFVKSSVLDDERSFNRFMDSVPKEMKVGGKVTKKRRDGIAQRGKTRA